MRRKTCVVLLAFFASLALPAISRALAPAEVACEEARLGRLVHRMATNGPGMNSFIWQAGADRYRGLGVCPSFAGSVRRDWQMGFDLLLSRESDLLNPRRSLLPQAVLARNDLLTTPFDSPEEGPRIDVSLELAPQVVDPTNPRQGLRINSQYSTPTGSASGASRSLTAENLFERCSEDEPSAFDLKVFEILSRTFRVTDQLTQPFPGPGLDRYKAIFFRDVEPLTYRAKVWLYLTTCDPRCGYGEASFQFRLRFTLDGSGKLAAGLIETLPWCRNVPQPCTELLTPSVAVIVAPPLFAGHETQPEAVFKSGAFLNVEYEGSPNNILTDDIPWPALLRGTAWDRPLGVP